jgi:N-methylhydantoinase B/oxoprolinase/acetone carboxylase alpha subunit
MPQLDNGSLEISVDISQDDELITLNFKSTERHIAIGFNLQEAQLLSLVLAETVTAALIRKMKLFPDPSKSLH